jgi:hypothetical protein
MGFWKTNITGGGRAARIAGGVCLLVAAVLLRRAGVTGWPWVCGIGGAFMVFEGVRGWCVLRACKLKTPL